MRPLLLQTARAAALGVLATVLLAPLQNAPAQTAKPPAGTYEPQIGQEGKDVVWVPTSQALVDKMLDIAKVTPRDYVIDLGSGDGRTVITAAKRGARALGIEYNPDMVALSRRNAQNAGVTERATFNRADLFESDLSQANVITMFLLNSINMKLRPRLLELRPGVRIVSNTFSLGDWEADQTVRATEAEGCTSYCTAYLWIVPARVEGTWQTADGTLEIKQTFQKFAGTMTKGGTPVALTNGRLRADLISFTAGAAEYSGRVAGNRIEGTVKTAGGTTKWSAARSGS